MSDYLEFASITRNVPGWKGEGDVGVDHGAEILSDAVNNSAEYLKSIKRFDMEGFIVRKDYYREMKRYGVIDESMPIEQVDPYVADSIYWSRR